MAEHQNTPQPGGQQTGRVRIFIADHTGNRNREARLAAHADIETLVPAVVTAMSLPVTDPSGRAITYHLAYNERQLQQEETLASAGIIEGATITLVPEMTAGAGGVR